MPHDHEHERRHGFGPAVGHNAPAGHLHSHVEDADRAEALRALAAQFIEGFVAASDKAAYLKLADVPLEREDPDGGSWLKLVDVKLTTEWQVGTAAPAFGSRELSYLPFPGAMISERTNMSFVYVSADRREDMDLRTFLAERHPD